MMTTSITDQFSERLQYNWVEFYFTNLITLVGFYFISVVFFQISFKPQKGTPTMVTPPTYQIPEIQASKISK